KGAHFPQDIILMGVRWYVAYPLSYRHVEELMEERGVPVDHATIQRWVVKYSPLLEEAFHRRKRPVWVSWRMDETYVKVKGQWRYLYRAVDKHGQTIDFLLTEHRDTEAALRFLKKAIWGFRGALLGPRDRRVGDHVGVALCGGKLRKAAQVALHRLKLK